MDVTSRRQIAGSQGLDGPSPPASRPSWKGLLAATVISVAATWAPCHWAAGWLHVETTRVVVGLEAPEGTVALLAFGAAESEQVPLVRIEGHPWYGQPGETWVAEIPPRRLHTLSLRFPQGVKGARFKFITLVSLRRNPPLTLLGDDPQGPKTEGVTLSCEAGESWGRVEWERPIPWSATAAFRWLWLGSSVAVAFLLLALWLLLARACPSPGPRRATRRRSWLAICGGLILVTQVGWILSTPSFIDGDSAAYIARAFGVLERADFDGVGVGAIDRLPGYPALIAAVFGVFGSNLLALALAQAALYTAALTLFAWALRRHLPLWSLLAGMVLSGLSPVQLHYLRTMLSESSYVSFSLLALGMLVESWSRRGAGRLAWLVMASLMAAFAIFIRPSGVAHVLPLVVMWIGAITSVSTLRGAGWRRLRRWSLPYAVAALLLLGPVVTWCTRNYLVHGYLAPASIAQLSRLVGEDRIGVLDPRVFVDMGAYDNYVTRNYEGRYVSNNMSTIWQLRSTLERRARDQGLPPSRHLRIVEDGYGDLVRASRAGSPFQVSLVRVLRSLLYNLRVFRGSSYLSIQPVPSIPTTSRVDASGIHQLNRDVSVPERTENSSLARAMIHLSGHYDTVYRALIIGSLIGVLIILWLGYYPLATCFAFYLGNVAVATLTLPDHRYTDVLDVFLIWTVVPMIGLVVGSRPPRAAAREIRSERTSIPRVTGPTP